MTIAAPPAEAAVPAEVAALDARARRVKTPCGDGTMVWRIWGEGEPLVLAHGAQGSWMHWLRNIDELAQTRTVIAADLPGHGDSALPATSGHAGICRALADGLERILGGPRAVDLCGFSFGGVAFSFFAAFHPEYVRRLVLVGCGGLDTPLGRIDLGRISGLAGEERRVAIRRNLLGLMLHHPASVDEFALWQLPHNARLGRLDVPHLVLPDRLCLVLPDVTAPLGAIWGEFDRPHPDPAVQEKALRRIRPDVLFRVVEGAGHWAMFEHPKAFDAALRDILAMEEAEQ